MQEQSSSARGFRALAIADLLSRPEGERAGEVVTAPLPGVDGEEWRLVPGSDGRYAVSSHGRLWSNVSRRQMRLFPGTSGHLDTSLRVHGISYHVTLHALMALAFLGPPPEGMDTVRHLNDDKAGNELVNLAWGTQADNLRDAVANGVLTLSRAGESNPRAKLSARDVQGIRALLSVGTSRRDIMHAFGVSKSTVSSIAVGRTWAGVA